MVIYIEVGLEMKKDSLKEASGFYQKLQKKNGVNIIKRNAKKERKSLKWKNQYRLSLNRLNLNRKIQDY